MIDKFKKWLLRWRTSRGFGVQSPSAYQFIKFVVREDWAYYRYKNIESKYSESTQKQINVLKCFFRLSNFWQADIAVMEISNSSIGEMISMGCKKTVVTNSVILPEEDYQRYIYIIRCENGCFRKFVSSIAGSDSIERVGDRLSHVMLIVTDINADEIAESEWQSIVSSDWSVRSYDVVEFGIVFFEKQMLKEHYFLDI